MCILNRRGSILLFRSKSTTVICSWMLFEEVSFLNTKVRRICYPSVISLKIFVPHGCTHSHPLTPPFISRSLSFSFAIFSPASHKQGVHKHGEKASSLLVMTVTVYFITTIHINVASLEHVGVKGVGVGVGSLSRSLARFLQITC